MSKIGANSPNYASPPVVRVLDTVDESRFNPQKMGDDRKASAARSRPADADALDSQLQQEVLAQASDAAEAEALAEVLSRARENGSSARNPALTQAAEAEAQKIEFRNPLKRIWHAQKAKLSGAGAPFQQRSALRKVGFAGVLALSLVMGAHLGWTQWQNYQSDMHGLNAAQLQGLSPLLKTGGYAGRGDRRAFSGQVDPERWSKLNAAEKTRAVKTIWKRVVAHPNLQSMVLFTGKAMCAHVAKGKVLFVQ